jgi:hypothetical protein
MTILIKSLLIMTLFITLVNVTLHLCFFIYFYKQVKIFISKISYKESHLKVTSAISNVFICNVTHFDIVSKSLSETMDCPQMFIVKIWIIHNTHGHHIYMKRKEGARVQDSGETEREREREIEAARIVANWVSVYSKNGHWKNGPFWDKFRRIYFNSRKVF